MSAIDTRNSIMIEMKSDTLQMLPIFFLLRNIRHQEIDVDLIIETVVESKIHLKHHVLCHRQTCSDMDILSCKYVYDHDFPTCNNINATYVGCCMNSFYKACKIRLVIV
jgi:hypothetical protein